METREKYEKLISKIRKNESRLKNKEEFAGSILDKIGQTSSETRERKFLYFIFGWADNAWLRRSLASISLILIFIFLFQQFLIIERIGDLEGRMVEGNSEAFNDYLIQKGSKNSLILTLSKDEAGDSILIAEKDLLDLIRSYRDLQKRYEDLENLMIDRKNLQGMPEDKNYNSNQKTNKKIKT